MYTYSFIQIAKKTNFLEVVLLVAMAPVVMAGDKRDVLIDKVSKGTISQTLSQAIVTPVFSFARYKTLFKNQIDKIHLNFIIFCELMLYYCDY